jgi:hypothetical protein
MHINVLRTPMRMTHRKMHDRMHAALRAALRTSASHMHTLRNVRSIDHVSWFLTQLR